MSLKSTQIAENVLRLEAEAILGLINHLGVDFDEIVSQIYTIQGKFLVTGIGKSAIIGQKIVATFNSTGTPAYFMHAADAFHGDLGLVGPRDLILCISNSGNTPEIIRLLGLIKNYGIKTIAMTGNPHSRLARMADLCLYTKVEKEACPHNLAPTCSTTAQLAAGDALAIAVLEIRQFSQDDFARLHPGGMLGKKLLLTAGEMASRNAKPVVRLDDPIKTVIHTISSSRLGATAVLDHQGQIVGIITDGDIRRMLEKFENIQGITAADICTLHPKIMAASTLAEESLRIIRKHKIGQVIIMEGDSYLGIIHLHDLIKEGFE